MSKFRYLLRVEPAHDVDTQCLDAQYKEHPGEVSCQVKEAADVMMVGRQFPKERQGGGGVYINIKRDPCQVCFGSKTRKDKLFFCIALTYG